MSLDTDFHLARTARRGLVAITLLCGATLAWGALVPFEGAVIASGTVVIDGNVKKVQHQGGGIVGTILVKEGAAVREGDVVLRLDDTIARSNLGVIMSEIATQQARSARLAAERDDRPEVMFASELLARAQLDASARLAIESERRLFDTRRQSREGAKAQLRERHAQIEKEIEGLERQLHASAQQLDIAVKERALLEPLNSKGLIQRPRITQLDREVERSKGIVGDTTARIEQSRLRIKEVNVQIANIDRDRLAESNKELRESEARLEEYLQRRVAAEDQLQRTEVRAPISGVVHELTTNTVGGVVNTADTLMTIVPNPDHVVVEVRVLPTNRDQIAEHQAARVRFSAFNQRITPELKASVIRVSPNTTRDPQTGVTYYTAALAILDDQFAKLKGQRLVPGMLADAFITTDQRTALGYLTKQFLDYLSFVFRDR